MCWIKKGVAPNDTVTSSLTTHSVAEATTSSARLRAYSSAPISPAAISATTMTTTRTIDSGSRNRFLIFPSAEPSFCGAPGGGGATWLGAPCGGWCGCGGGGPGGPGGFWPGGTWLAGRAQESVTPAILPYRLRGKLCGYAAPRSCP